MNFIRKYGIYVYLILLATHCCFIYFDVEAYRFCTKIALVPLLLWLFLASPGKIKDAPFYLPIIALLGSFMGDLLLTFEGPGYFLIGMVGFMITHICNGAFFYALSPISLKKSKTAWLSLIILSVACLFVFYLIKASVGALLLPIMVYMGLISLMAVLAANLLDSPTQYHAAVRYFVPGAILFVLSDGLLAINKFILQDSSMDIFVMLTYGLAQLYLVMGYNTIKSQN